MTMQFPESDPRFSVYRFTGKANDRPAASRVVPGAIYEANDTGAVFYRGDRAVWRRIDFGADTVEAQAGDGLSYVSLMTGADSEVPNVTSGTYSVDTTNFKVGDRGHKLAIAGAATATMLLDPVGPTDPVSVGYVSAVGLWIHISNAANVNYVGVDLYQTDVGTPWSRTSLNVGSQTLQNGWNLLRWSGHESTNALWTLYRARVQVVTTGAVDVTVGHLWLERQPKASVVFVDDSCYKSFRDYAYASFQARAWPVTWAPDPAILGSFVGTAGERMSVASLLECVASGNGDSVSFHGWDGAVTASMTNAQIRTDTVQAQRWIGNNIPGRASLGRFWRAAWTQNSATNAAASFPYVWASATYAGTSGSIANPLPEGWRLNVPRYGLHGRTTSEIDTTFANLVRNRNLMVVYTHGVDPQGGTYITPELMDHVIATMDSHERQGVLEVVTMEQLFLRSGGRFRNTAGRWAAEWTDATGALRTLALA